MRGLPDVMLDGHPQIPWREVNAIGNRLRHEYHRISTPIIWAIIQDELQPLRAAIAAMLESERR